MEAMKRPVATKPPAPVDPTAHIDAILREIDAVLAQEDLLNPEPSGSAG
jgi:hypothetical protein